MKLILGFVLAFAIGAVCRLAKIPSPAPNALLGSLLVVAMSVGYIAAERVLARPNHSSLSLPMQFRCQSLEQAVVGLGFRRLSAAACLKDHVSGSRPADL
jgi:XapX domain-containing protein